jgi:mannose-6-phosphate isomerase-like protein (cupin superfamily)
MNSVKKVDKSWGYELWLANNEKENYCGKILYINPGYAGSMHFHSKKHETFYILEGTLKVDVLNPENAEKTTHLLKEGETFVLDRLTPHQLFATDKPVKFIEISTFHDDADSYRVWR